MHILSVITSPKSILSKCIVHRRPEGVTWGSCPPWNLKMMTSYAVFVQNALKFSLAPFALA